MRTAAPGVMISRLPFPPPLVITPPGWLVVVQRSLSRGPHQVRSASLFGFGFGFGFGLVLGLG